MNELDRSDPETVLLFIVSNFKKVQTCKFYADHLVDLNHVSPFEEWVKDELCKEMENIFGPEFVHENTPLVHWIVFLIQTIVSLETDEYRGYYAHNAAVQDKSIITNGIKLFLTRSSDVDYSICNFNAMEGIYRIFSAIIAAEDQREQVAESNPPVVEQPMEYFAPVVPLEYYGLTEEEEE